MRAPRMVAGGAGEIVPADEGKKGGMLNALYKFSRPHVISPSFPTLRPRPPLKQETQRQRRVSCPCDILFRHAASESGAGTLLGNAGLGLTAVAVDLADDPWNHPRIVRVRDARAARLH